MSEEQVTGNREPGNEPDAGHGPRAWLGRHRHGLSWIAVLAAIVIVQWSLLKGWAYRITGAPAPADGIAWRSGYQAALAEAEQTGKPVLLDFSATWCPPCQAMKHDVWPDANVRDAVNNGYIPVAVDVDAAGSQELARRYGIDTIPAIVVVDAEGRVLRQASYMSRSALLEFLGRKSA